MLSELFNALSKYVIVLKVELNGIRPSVKLCIIVEVLTCLLLWYWGKSAVELNKPSNTNIETT